MSKANKIKPKNRKKPYKPKKDQLNLNSIKQIVSSKGVDGLYDHFKEYKRLDKHYLEMKWDIFDVNTTIDLYCLMNNISLSGDDPLPLELLDMIYKGDLIYALRKQLIDPTQEFRIEIHSRARHVDNSDDIVTLEPYIKDFAGDPINYEVFMQGKDKGKHYFKRDGVFKTLWEGVTKEWNINLDGQYSDDYEVFEAKAKLSCTTPFYSWLQEKEFKQYKLLGQMRRF